MTLRTINTQKSEIIVDRFLSLLQFDNDRNTNSEEFSSKYSYDKTIISSRVTGFSQHDDNMVESRTSTVEFKDFDTKTLQAFCDSLFSDRVDQSKETALRVYILVDKYDVNGGRLQS